MPTPPFFLRLPLELIRAIISHLSLEDILSLKRSCKSLSHMVCEPDLQPYHFRMRNAGLRDRPPPEGLSVRERLAALRRWESAWDDDQGHDQDDEDDKYDDEDGVKGIPGIFAADDDPATQQRRIFVDIEDSDPDSRILLVEDFYVEMHALADSRADFCEYKYLDLRSSSLRREDVRSARHVFKQEVSLLCYAFAIEKYNLFAVLIEAPWLCDYAALQLLNFYDGKPHPLADRPIPITDKRFCIAKMHIIEDQILLVMTLDFPARPESWLTLVGLKDLCVTPIEAPSNRYLNDIVILSHDTIALINPVDKTLELYRINIATATLHILRTIDLPSVHSDLSLVRASITTHGSPPAPRDDAPAALFYEDPARTITCIALHYTAESLDPGEWREVEEQARVLIVTRHSALLALAIAAQNAQTHARTPWRTWSSDAARVLRPVGAGTNYGFGMHATSHEHLFLFARKTPASFASSATTTDSMTVAHFDFNPHRVSRPRISSTSSVHQGCCARPRAVGPNTLCKSDWKRGDCAGESGHGCREKEPDDEDEDVDEDDITVKELPYRQTRITLPDDSDTYFGTDRIVFVRSRKVDQGSGVADEGLVRRRVIVHPMMG